MTEEPGFYDLLDTERARARAILQDELGIEENPAQLLLDHAERAARFDAVQAIVSGEPLPTTVADQRALRLRHICKSAGRFLSPHETAVLLRVSRDTANSLLKRVQTTYGLSLEPELKQHLVDSATAVDAGQGDYRITFDDPVAMSYAVRLLARRRVTHGIRENRSRLQITVAQTVEALDEGEMNSVDSCDLIGIDKPEGAG